MNKIYFIIISSILLSGCASQNRFQQAKLKAVHIVSKKINPMEEYHQAIDVLEAAPKQEYNLLVTYLCELGRMQETSVVAANQAGKTFQKALVYAKQAVKADEKADYTIDCELAYARCLVRNPDSLIPARIQLDHLQTLDLKDEFLLKWIQLEVGVAYHLRGNSYGQPAKQWIQLLNKGLNRLSDAYNPKSNTESQLITPYYLGLLNWLLFKTGDSDAPIYLNNAKVHFKRAEPYLKYPEMYHNVGNFYSEQQHFDAAKRLFENGYQLNINNLFFKCDYATALLQPIENQFNFNTFGNDAPPSDTLQIAKNLLQTVLETASGKTQYQPIVQQSYKWLYWMHALTKKQNADILPDALLANPHDNHLNYYIGLYWMHRNLSKAKTYWLKSAAATDDKIGAMSHFWLGYYATTEPEKKQHLDRAILLSGERHQDALYFRGLLELQNPNPKNWKKTTYFDKVLKNNDKYFAAREKRGYILLKKEQFADFDFLLAHGNDSFQLQAMIGKGFLNPDSVDLSRFRLVQDRYDAHTFLESYFHLQQVESDDPQFPRYAYFNKYLAAFRADKQVLPIVKSFVDEKKVVPRITWTHLGMQDSVSWFLSSQNTLNPITFNLSKRDIFKTIQVFLNEELIFEQQKPDSLYYNLNIPPNLVRFDTVSTLKIVATFKKKTKFNGAFMHTSKRFIFKQPNECVCEKKLAFIIQNNLYQDTSWRLPKTTYNESKQLDTLLKSKGFTTKLYANLDKKAFETMLNRDYRDSLPNYNVILFYYTGHGVSQQDKNYLLPTDFKDTDSLTISTESIYSQVEDFSKSKGVDMKDLKDKAFIYIFDACRSDSDSLLVGTQKDSKPLPHSVMVHTTRKGEEAFAFALNPNDITLFMTHFPKNFTKNADTDILQLLDIRSFLNKNEDEPQIPEITYNLGFQLFLLKR